MAIYAVINNHGTIINRIVLDEPALWSIPDGATIMEETGTVLEIGGTMINGVYAEPYRPPVRSALEPQADAIKAKEN